MEELGPILIAQIRYPNKQGSPYSPTTYTKLNYNLNMV